MKKPTYGVDAPGVIRNLLIIGTLCLVITFLLPVVWTDILSLIIAQTIFWPGIFLVVTGLSLLLYGKWGKFRYREKILSSYSWKGNENVLDVGTGLGLLLIGAAKKLTTGTAYGIDIFNMRDLSNNNLKQLQTNVALETVAKKVEVVEHDIQKTQFEDNYFDLILSNLCLHNISGQKGQKQACIEIVRILRPGGKAIISDFLHTGAYKRYFSDLGLKVKRTGPYFYGMIPPLFIVIAEKETSAIQ